VILEEETEYPEDFDEDWFWSVDYFFQMQDEGHITDLHFEWTDNRAIVGCTLVKPIKFVKIEGVLKI